MKKKFLILFSVLLLSLAAVLFIRLNPAFNGKAVELIGQDSVLKEVIENSTSKALERRKSWTKPASSELVSNDLPFWEKLFKNKNNISDDYFRKHIKVIYTSTATDKDRELSKPGERGKEYFFIDAVYSLDWVSFIISGEMTIKEAGSDELLSLSNIEKNGYYRISPLKAVDKLPYTFSEVLAALKKVNPEVIKLTPADFNPYSLGDIKGINLNAFGTINEEKNECVSLTIDILTLNGASSEAFCRIE